MARCETCGNDYDKAFQVSMNGSTHLRQFRMPIHALAPTCENCGIHIVGHGLEKDGTFFCCEHCAEVVGVTGLRPGRCVGSLSTIGRGVPGEPCAASAQAEMPFMRGSVARGTGCTRRRTFKPGS